MAREIAFPPRYSPYNGSRGSLMKGLYRIVALGTIGLIMAGCLSSSSDPAEVVGKPAPDLSGRDLSGRLLRLSDYRGKVVLLDFWMHT